MQKTAIRLLAGFVCIFASWAMGTVAMRYLHIPLPGPIIGLALLLCGLACVPRIETIVAPASRLLLRFLPFFLYPLGAGFLTLSGLHLEVFVKIAIAILMSLVVSMSLCAFTFRYLKRVRP